MSEFSRPFISDQLCDFLQVERGSRISRSEVYRAVTSYRKQ